MSGYNGTSSAPLPAGLPDHVIIMSQQTAFIMDDNTSVAWGIIAQEYNGGYIAWPLTTYDYSVYASTGVPATIQGYSIVNAGLGVGTWFNNEVMIQQNIGTADDYYAYDGYWRPLQFVGSIYWQYVNDSFVYQGYPNDQDVSSAGWVTQSLAESWGYNGWPPGYMSQWYADETEASPDTSASGSTGDASSSSSSTSDSGASGSGSSSSSSGSSSSSSSSSSASGTGTTDSGTSSSSSSSGSSSSGGGTSSSGGSSSGTGSSSSTGGSSTSSSSTTGSSSSSSADSGSNADSGSSDSPMSGTSETYYTPMPTSDGYGMVTTPLNHFGGAIGFVGTPHSVSNRWPKN